MIPSILLVSLLSTAFLWAIGLRIGLHLAKVPSVTVRSIAAATLIAAVLQVALFVAVFGFQSVSDALRPLRAIAELIVANVANGLVIMFVFRLTVTGAVKAWLPTFVAALVGLGGTAVMITPLIFEHYAVAENGMAPTLLGKHLEGKCAECGSVAYGDPASPEDRSSNPPQMICRDHFHVTQAAEASDQLFGGDRFLVNKYLTPRRWDLVAFKAPGNPEYIYVLRLVGLPGEEIIVRDGQISANGILQPKPESLHENQYLGELPESRRDLWGSPARPAKLGDDEYFVLGDFSQYASDSRTWRRGTAGHPSFAVPRSNLKGVVTNIFWPLSRWQIFR